MKKLMILGASYSQMPLIQAAKRLGIYTIVCSTPGSWPGFAEADECSYTDISDPQAVLAEARRTQIQGITTCCLDTGVPAIGTVCEAMGLTGPKAIPAQTASDKWKMKEAFVKAGVQTARHIRVRSEEELEAALSQLTFPVILKAVDLMGSRGIFRSNTKEEARANYRLTMEATGKDYCLVEEFIEGTLFGAEAMLKDGKFLYCLLDNTEAFISAVPTPVGHSVPFDEEKALGAQAREQVGKAVKALGLDNCPVNCDLICKDGRVYVVEITARAGATCLPEIVGEFFGINYYEAIVRLALDLGVEEMFHLDGEHPAVLSHTLLSLRDGIVKEIRNDNAPSGDILDLSFNICPGEEIHRYRNGRDRLGQVILKGSTLTECRKRLQEVLSKIHIEFME